MSTWHYVDKVMEYECGYIGKHRYVLKVDWSTSSDILSIRQTHENGENLTGTTCFGKEDTEVLAPALTKWAMDHGSQECREQVRKHVDEHGQFWNDRVMAQEYTQDQDLDEVFKDMLKAMVDRGGDFRGRKLRVTMELV